MNYFLEGLTSKVTNLDHILLGAINQILYRVDARTLQAVEGTNRQVKLLNGHLQDFFLFHFRSFYEDFGVLCLIRHIDEEFKVLVENLGGEGNRFLCSDGSVEWAAKGEKVVLVRLETSPEDITGMKAAQGILTVRGGMTSHAAVVLIWIFKKFDDELGIFLENIFQKLYSRYITYGKAISETDLSTIKEKNENLHLYITKYKAQTHCYPVCFLILKALQKGNFLFIAVKNFEYQKVDNNNFYTMHALYVHDDWCYDTISGIQHPLDMILKHFQGKEYMYISYDDVKDLTYDEFREKYADGLNLWCKENDCYVSFCAD